MDSAIARTSSTGVAVPVGLFGVQRNATFAPRQAAAKPSTSTPKSRFRGTVATPAPWPRAARP